MFNSLLVFFDLGFENSQTLRFHYCTVISTYYLFGLLKFTGYQEISFVHLKLVSAIFYQIFIFSPYDSPLKTMKNVFYFI